MPCPSGRCRLHGGASTGPRTPEGKARIAAAARLGWAEAYKADDKHLPTAELREATADLLERTTWAQAMDLTGLSRRQLERVERGAYCTPAELVTIAEVLGVEAPKFPPTKARWR